MKRVICVILSLVMSVALCVPSVFAAESLLRVSPRIDQYFMTFAVREKPSILSKRIGILYKYPPMGPVKWTGREVNGYCEIYYGKHGHNFGWVFGEYFGVTSDSDYVEFNKPVTYAFKVGGVIARCKPSIFSGICGFCGIKGTKIRIVGRKGLWLRTDRDKWIYFQLLEKHKP